METERGWRGERLPGQSDLGLGAHVKHFCKSLSKDMEDICSFIRSIHSFGEHLLGQTKHYLPVWNTYLLGKKADEKGLLGDSTFRKGMSTKLSHCSSEVK